MRKALVVLLFVLTASAVAQERLELGAPHPTPGTIFRVSSIELRRAHAEAADVSAIRVTFREIGPSGIFTPNGKSMHCTFFGHDAEAKIIAMNKQNFSTQTMEKTLILQCQAASKIGAGMIVGSAQ